MNPEQNQPNTQQNPPQQSVQPQPSNAAQQTPQPGTLLVNQLNPELQKKIKNAAIAVLVLGIVSAVLSVALIILVTVASLLDLLISIGLIVCGAMLLSNKITFVKSVILLRTSAIIITISLTLAIIARLLAGEGGVGLLPILALIFITSAFTKLYEAGLVTSKSPVLAKSK